MMHSIHERPDGPLRSQKNMRYVHETDTMIADKIIRGATLILNDSSKPSMNEHVIAATRQEPNSTSKRFLSAPKNNQNQAVMKAESTQVFSIK